MSLFRCAGGSSIRRLTSAGSDNGASPIRDLHREVKERGLVEILEDRGGTKKSGSSIEAPRGTAPRQLDLIIMLCIPW